MLQLYDSPQFLILIGQIIWHNDHLKTPCGEDQVCKFKTFADNFLLKSAVYQRFETVHFLPSQTCNRSRQLTGRGFSYHELS